MLSVVEMRGTRSHFRPLCEQSQGTSPPILYSVVLSLLQGTESLRLATTTARDHGVTQMGRACSVIGSLQPTKWPLLLLCLAGPSPEVWCQIAPVVSGVD